MKKYTAIIPTLLMLFSSNTLPQNAVSGISATDFRAVEVQKFEDHLKQKYEEKKASLATYENKEKERISQKSFLKPVDYALAVGGIVCFVAAFQERPPLDVALACAASLTSGVALICRGITAFEEKEASLEKLSEDIKTQEADLEHSYRLALDKYHTPVIVKEYRKKNSKE